MTRRRHYRNKNNAIVRGEELSSARLNVFGLIIIIITIFIGFNLFDLMIFKHSFYSLAASNLQQISSDLLPNRGRIYFMDSRNGESFPVAINHRRFLIYADNRYIYDDNDRTDIIKSFVEILNYDDDKVSSLLQKINKEGDTYEILEKNIEEDIVKEFKKRKTPGLGYVLTPVRFYPERSMMAHIIGFVGKNDKGEDVGRYGVEGYWDDELKGESGFFSGTKSGAGRLISLADKVFEPAKDGVDITLTIDRSIQYESCKVLEEAVKKYGAKSGSILVMDPNNGAIRAMCNIPTFDPNDYSSLSIGSTYNNNSIFTSYEPGSIFKPITMSGALNEGKVSINSPFYDKGFTSLGCEKSIKNAGERSYNQTDMEGVLKNSINTGMVYVVDILGKEKFREYVETFGFGVKSGLELDTEVAGNISTLYENKNNKLDCYTATASFGQGITVTPLQMVTAFAVFANGGILYKPYIIDHLVENSEKITKTEPRELRRIISSRTANNISTMLENVIGEGTHAKGARVVGYRIAGKTGTAQIAEKGGYSESEFNHSFVGYAPVEKPVFVAFVKLENPKAKYSSETAAPTFGEIAKFILQYYKIPPSDKRE